MYLAFSSAFNHKSEDIHGTSEVLLGGLYADEFNDSCILEGSSSEYLRAYSKSNISRPSEWMKRIILSTDTSVYANQCRLYSWPNSCYLVGSCLNWNVRKCPTDHPTASHNLDSNDKYASIDEGIVFQSRGFKVYGHWLLDYLPRLLMIKEYCNDRPGLPIIIRNIPRWGKTFMLRLGITNPIVSVPEGGELRVKLLHIPLIMKEGSMYYEPTLAKSFAAIRQIFVNADTNQSSSFPDKIFFARSKAPFAINQDEAIDFYARHGFQCIFPESLSLDDQISMYSRCRVFIGEDSSAMHNIGFATHSSSLIFSRKNRINLWHAAVASATGQYIRPILSTMVSSNDDYCIPLNHELVDDL